MSEPTVWTVGALLNWTKDYLEKHDSDSPRLDAEILLAHVRGCERIDLYVDFAQVPDDEQRAAFRELVRQRAQGKPVAYLVGHREFYSMSFYVSPAVLIPRPETEYLVIAALDLLKQQSDGAAGSPCHIADVGTGSGIVAVSLAKNLPTAQLVATDLSSAALEIAARNAHSHQVQDRIQFVECDLLSEVSGPFDLVLSNPPYVTDAEYEQLPRDIKEFEPELALRGGSDGLDPYRRLIPQAYERLRPGGYLVMEISPMIETEVLKLLRSSEFTCLPTLKDQAQLARTVVAQKPTG